MRFVPARWRALPDAARVSLTPCPASGRPQRPSLTPARPSPYNKWGNALFSPLPTSAVCPFCLAREGAARDRDQAPASPSARRPAPLPVLDSALCLRRVEFVRMRAHFDSRRSFVLGLNLKTGTAAESARAAMFQARCTGGGLALRHLAAESESVCLKLLILITLSEYRIITQHCCIFLVTGTVFERMNILI